jgi:hypothetical protein
MYLKMGRMDKAQVSDISNLKYELSIVVRSKLPLNPL